MFILFFLDEDQRMYALLSLDGYNEYQFYVFALLSLDEDKIKMNV